MARTKARKAEPADLDFTERRRQAMGFVPERTHVMEGERRVTLHTIRRRCPAMNWGWLNDSERAALVRYADLAERVEVSVKGCLAPQSGGDRDVGAERRMMRQDEYQRAKRACTGPALAFVDHALLGDSPPSFDVVCSNSFGPSRDAARITGRAMVGIVAKELVRHFAG